MEGAPVTAATGALGPVIAKLDALLGSQYKLRLRTRKDVKFIRSKLRSMHSILWATWEKEDLDAESKDLKKEALDLTADMYDAIDDFIQTMECNRRNKRLIQRKSEASPFQDFKRRAGDVSGRYHSKCKWKKKNKYEHICSLFPRKNAKSNAPSKQPLPRAPFVHKDASELIGMGRWKDDLIGYLVGEGEEGEGGGESTMVQPQLKMASIVGMAGVGKTTLAHLVYEEIKNKFQSWAFVSVTPTPNMKEVLTDILQQVRPEPLAGIEESTEEDIIHAISNFLEDKRYLVIIDDIWHRGEWEIIRKSFPENNLGSRIVMTTRIDYVPGNDFDNNMLCNRMNPQWCVLPTETPEWDFFTKRSETKYRWLYGPDKEDVAAQMKPGMVGDGFDCDHPLVQMCAGVPLALLCMFSAMVMIRKQQQLGEHVSDRDVQEIVDKHIKRSGIQNTPGFEPLVESLQLGYNDLPHHMLKTCLLYCSIYPDDYRVNMNDMVKRWVAEGFIHNKDAAKGYFKELVGRGLILPAIYRDYQLNPMMRNFLRWKSREDNFITCSSDITSAYACSIHRLCIDHYPVDDGALIGLDWSQVRSLVVFEGAERLPFDKLERVRVLDLHLKRRSALANHHVEDMCRMLRVRYLFGLEGERNLEGGNISEIPPEIGRLTYLENLQLRRTCITKLPSEIGRLKKLKSLDVSDNGLLSELPREIGDLQHLETLCMSDTYITELPWESIGRLKKLKTLDMRHNGQITELPREIGELQHLETLDLSNNTSLTELPREIGKLYNLKRLLLNSANVSKIPREIGDLRNLKTLDLSYNGGLTDLPREIGNLQNLRRLLLRCTKVVKIPREIGGLKKLEILVLEKGGSLEKETIGALPWEAGQLSELEGVPEFARQAWKNSDLVSELAREILSIQMLSRVGDSGGLIVGTKHMHIPRWIKEHFKNLESLDIRIGKLEEQDLEILREMPSLCYLTLRFEVVPRMPITISSEGFRRLVELVLDSRMPPAITFQRGAMRMLGKLEFECQFYGGPPNKDPLGIKHLRSLWCVAFRCDIWYDEEDPCISTMIEVVRKEARLHPNKIKFHFSSYQHETFPANQSANDFSSDSESSELSESGSEKGEIEEVTFAANESAKVTSSSGAGAGEIEEETFAASQGTKVSNCGTSEIDDAYGGT